MMVWQWRMPVVACAIILALSCRHPYAAEIVNPNLEDDLAGRVGTTYLDLARLIASDLKAASYGYTGRQMISMRALGEGEPTPGPSDEFSIAWVSAFAVGPASAKQLLVLFNVDEKGPRSEPFAPLVLFDLSGPPKILDAVDVALDRDTAFRETESWSVSPDADIVVTASTHANSGQFYVQSPLILVRGSKIELIDTILTFNDLGCGFERGEPIVFTAAQGSVDAPGPFRVEVVETTTVTEETCGDDQIPKAGSRTFSTTYNWDKIAQRYVPDSDALDRLAADNRNRF